MTRATGPDHAVIRAADIPLGDLAGSASHPAAIAMIRGTEGAAYRPVGAAMLFDAAGQGAGNLSSGCIDADIAHHAAAAIADGLGRDLRYGIGSPFLDIALPCGGGLDIRVLPLADPAHLLPLRRAVAARLPVRLWLGPQRLDYTPFAGADLCLTVLPDVQFLAFGKGPEAVAFAHICAGAGYQTWLSSPDAETVAGVTGGAVRLLPFSGARPPDALPIDRHTAVALFFHDHEAEPAILRRVLASDAFYVGAQGSRRTAARRIGRLRDMGVAEAALARLHGPMGLIPSTRDARTLAVSVLAEILSEAARMAAAFGPDPAPDSDG